MEHKVLPTTMTNYNRVQQWMRGFIPGLDPVKRDEMTLRQDLVVRIWAIRGTFRVSLISLLFTTFPMITLLD